MDLFGCGRRPAQATVTTELSQVLDEEERRWTEPLQDEEFQITLAQSVIQVHTHTHTLHFLCLESVNGCVMCVCVCILNNLSFLQLQPKSTS